MNEEAILRNYFMGWPKKGKYVEDLNWAYKISSKFLEKVATNKKINPRTAIIFDVDETLVFGDAASVIGVQEMELGDHDGHSIFILPPNPPIVNILRKAKRLGIKIIILTARPGTSKAATIANLEMFKIPFDYIICNNKDSDPEFKSSARKQLSSKFDILLTVGDQSTDCLLPGRSAILKLPDPNSLCCYFFANGRI